MRIRPTTLDDLPQVMEIYAYARSFMAWHGNPNQWGPTNWPPEALIRRDIAEGKSYVCVTNAGTASPPTAPAGAWAPSASTGRMNSAAICASTPTGTTSSCRTCSRSWASPTAAPSTCMRTKPPAWRMKSPGRSRNRINSGNRGFFPASAFVYPGRKGTGKPLTG